MQVLSRGARDCERGEAFARAVDEVTHAARHLLASLQTAAPPRDRAVEVLDSYTAILGQTLLKPDYIVADMCARIRQPRRRTRQHEARYSRLD